MLPFEFTIKGPPISLQTKNKARLNVWRQQVRAAATAMVKAGVVPIVDPVTVTITYYYDGDTPDVDNIIKPIQDALIGVVFVDDAQVIDTRCRKKSLNGSYRINGASAILLQAFSDNVGFLHVRIQEPGDGQDLTQ